jgi:LPPG:FO 2-phospho-L-lactate transferase
MITVLTGGTGGAKFVDGLRRVVSPDQLTVIVNTGDDFTWWGLHISPDIDSITYVLAGVLSNDRGWGFEGDTFECLARMRAMGQPAWFQIGDRDLATHLLRTQLLQSGKTLSEATFEITRSHGLKERVLPMTDSPVATQVEIAEGEISFQEYFVRRRFKDEVRRVRFAGAESAGPAPGVEEAILSADAVLLAPSNPITSIGPMLAVRGIREALRKTPAPLAAVSPIVGSAAVSGPAGALMAAHALPVSIAGVARAYEDFLDVLIADSRDEDGAEALRKTGLQVYTGNTIMKSEEDRIQLAHEVMSAVQKLRQAEIAS